MKQFYPVNLNVAGRRCVVVGGGMVALRKIRGLIDCGAEVHVISPEIVAGIESYVTGNEIIWHRRRYEAGDLHGVFLAVAATDDTKTQQMVASDAESARILVNVVDDPSVCSFQVPAKIRRGGLLVTVSTGGGSPALAARIRRELETEFEPEYEQLVLLLAHIRERVVGNTTPSVSHKELFEKLLQLDMLELIKNEDWETLQEGIVSLLPEGVDADGVMDVLLASASSRVRPKKEVGR